MRALTLIISLVALLTAGCSAVRVVDTGAAPVTTPVGASAAPTLPPTNDTLLVNAFDYATQQANGQTGYDFTTPSGRWRCAILPHVMAGCQPVDQSSIGIAGAPDTVVGARGEQSAPNAIVVEAQGDARFAALGQQDLTPADGAANVLPYNRTLIVARFRCNVQEEVGISCASEQSGSGFTFSADGFTTQYTEVPVDAP